MLGMVFIVQSFFIAKLGKIMKFKNILFFLGKVKSFSNPPQIFENNVFKYIAN